MARARALLLTATLVALLLWPSVPAAACDVPCGYIYPRLLFDLGSRSERAVLTSAHSLDLRGNLTFTWDITAEGLAAPNPTSPIVVSFQFPRKPAWLQASLDPSRIEVPLSPQYLEPAQNAAGAQLVYKYTVPIRLQASLLSAPTLQPDDDGALLILASSSESGLYKPGFGVRDLKLDLPEATRVSAERAPTAAMRVGDAASLVLADAAQSLAWEEATLRLDSPGPIRLWEPAPLVVRAMKGAQPARMVDMAASIVDERNALLYTTGLREREDGALAFNFTFPSPGQYRVLAAIRPVPGATNLAVEPVVATFDVALPGWDFDALRYPETYRAAYLEPTGEFHANAQDLPRQYEKLLRFPVLRGADSVSVQVQVASTLGAALAAGSLYGELLGPADEQLAYGKMDPTTPGWDVRLPGPLPEGEYKVHFYGTGFDPLGAAGTLVDARIGVFYREPPVGRVTTRGMPQPLPGGNVSLGTGGMELNLVLHQDPALWAPLHATLVTQSAAGAVALHPDFILTVRGPGGILYTTGHRHPHDGVLEVGFALPAPGWYTVSAYAGPTPEVSGGFWQPASASWPFYLPAAADGLMRYPAMYRAEYMDSTSTVRSDGYGGGAPFEKRYPVPILAGAQQLTARLDVSTMAVSTMLDGVTPASLSVEILDAANASLGSAPLVGAGSAEVNATTPAPGRYTVRVAGVGYAPLDYSGSMYHLSVEAQYAQAPVERDPAAASKENSPARVPGFEVVGAVALLAALGFRRRA